MKKAGLMIIAALILIIPFASADVQLRETAVNTIIIKELNIPAVYDITIVNDNYFSDIFNIDTLLDINITPQENILINGNSEKTVRREIYPSEELREKQKGLLAFEYYANGDKSNVKKSSMTLEFVSLADIITIGMPATVTKDDTEINVIINLTKDVELDGGLTLVSELLSYSEDVKLTNSGIILTVPLKSTMPQAGTYEVKATLDIDGYEYSESKNIVLKSEILIEEQEPVVSGYFLDRKIVYEKDNAGNSVTDVTVSVKKSVIAGLFTTFSEKPSEVKRQGNTAIYEFTEELNPGESLIIESRTSYYLPIAILALIIIAGWIFVVVTTPQVKVMKKAVKVRTRSGVFATKMVIAVRNAGKNSVSELKIIDRLPPFTELVPEKFGTISPSEVKKHTLIWNIDSLGSNEEMMLSYIVYSKLTIIGKLDVPLAYATYKDIKGNLKESKSNGLVVIAPEQPVQSVLVE